MTGKDFSLIDQRNVSGEKMSILTSQQLQTYSQNNSIPLKIYVRF